MKKSGHRKAFIIDSMILVVAWYICIAAYWHYYPDNNFYLALNCLHIFFFPIVGPIYFVIAFALISISNRVLSKLLPRVKEGLIHGGVMAAFLLLIFVPLGKNITHYYVLGPSGRQAEKIAKEDRTKAKAERTLKKLYREKGLKGKVKVTSISNGGMPGEVYDVYYTYREKDASGQTFTQKQESLVDIGNDIFEDPLNDQQALMKGGIVPADFQGNWLGATANSQPAVKEQYAVEETSLNQQLPEYMKVQKVECQLNKGVNKKSATFSELKQAVLANRQKDLLLGGYYNIDVPQLAKDGALGFKVTVKFNNEEVLADPQKEKAQNAADLTLVSGMNFNDFWDGNYYFDFITPKNYGLKTVKAVVQNGQLQDVQFVDSDDR